MSIQFLCVDFFELVVFFPPFILGSALLVAKPAYVHHEHPGESVHNHAAELHYQRGPGRSELTVKHHRANSHTHKGEQNDKKQVHGVTQQAVVQAQLAEEPAGLQQGIGELAAEDHPAGLAAWNSHEQRQQDAQDARGVVGQHDRAFCVVAHTPANVKEEVAEADGQGKDLELRVLRTWS